MTGDAPFKSLHEDDIRQVVLKEGQRPQRPKEPEFLERGLTSPMWGLMKLFWADDEQNRPQFLGIVQSMERLNNTTASAKPDSDDDDYIVYMRGLYTENLLENDLMRQLPLSASIKMDGKYIWTRNISRKKGDPDDKYPSFVVRQSSNISFQLHHNNVNSNWKLEIFLVVLSVL